MLKCEHEGCDAIEVSPGGLINVNAGWNKIDSPKWLCRAHLPPRPDGLKPSCWAGTSAGWMEQTDPERIRREVQEKAKRRKAGGGEMLPPEANWKED
jgi:hypothetical protein